MSLIDLDEQNVPLPEDKEELPEQKKVDDYKMDLESKKEFLPLLEVLRKLKSDDVPKIMDHLHDRCINHICECYYNVIHTDLKMSAKKRNKLRNHIKTNCKMHRLKTICSKSTPVFKRRKALKQEGKGLPLILSAAIPFLASLLFKK